MKRHYSYSLNRAERNRLLALLRAKGIKPPRIGWCVKALGGEVCRHRAGAVGKSDTGYQTIGIEADLVRGK